MTTSRDRIKKVVSWSTLALIIGGVWAVITFYYTQVFLPKTAPINISLKLELKKIGPRAGAIDKDNLVAVELQTTATNPSSREVYLLKSAWVATACNVEMKKADASENREFVKSSDALLNSTQENEIELFSVRTGCTYVAAGRLFADLALKPNESIHRAIVFYVPSNKYDELTVQVRMPSEEKIHSDLRQKDELVSGGIDESFCQQIDKITCVQLTTDSDFAKFDVQEAHAQAAISLWQ